ncbi:MAG: hypothetical protein AABY22_04630, partial [Nanoarchaeota archaeon]
MKVLLDLDGTVVDFVAGMCKAHNRPDPYDDEENFGIFDMSTIWGMSNTEFWKNANSEFWSNLSWLNDGKQILSLVESYAGAENVCILTAPSLNEDSATGKFRWINRELPNYSRRCLVGAAKDFIASPGLLLIDDYPKNTEAFAKNGGKAILVPRK